MPAIDGERAAAGDAAVLHDHEAAGRGAAGVHPDAAVHAARARTTWRPGWWRAATASTTAGCWCSSSRSRRWCSARARSSRASTRTRSSRRRSRCGTSRAREVIQGTLLVIPIEESLIYIRPLYLRAAGGRIPELKRVIVAYQNQIVMEETLDAALNRMFPRGGRTVGAARALLRERRRRPSRRRPKAATSCPHARWKATAGRSRRSVTATGRSTARRSRNLAKRFRKCGAGKSSNLGSQDLRI